MISNLLYEMKIAAENVLLKKYKNVETGYQQGKVVFLVGDNPKKMITLTEID